MTRTSMLHATLKLSVYLRVKAFNVKIRHQELDGLLVYLILPHLAELDHIVEERRVRHARQTIGLERCLDEVHFLLGNVQLELFRGKGLRDSEMDGSTCREGC